jgi:hypothetical protein
MDHLVTVEDMMGEDREDRKDREADFKDRPGAVFGRPPRP